jgi:hypothetical protein
VQHAGAFPSSNASSFLISYRARTMK